MYIVLLLLPSYHKNKKILSFLFAFIKLDAKINYNKHLILEMDRETTLPANT